jgi:hypothetical protein
LGNRAAGSASLWKHHRLFVVIVTMALIYGVLRPQTAAIETQERRAVGQCWRSSRSLSPAPSRNTMNDRLLTLLL